MTGCYYHDRYAFQSESKFYSCMNVKELLARNRRNIWSLSDSNGIRTHSHLVRKYTLNHLAKLASLAKWLSVRLRTKWLWVRIPLLPLRNMTIQMRLLQGCQRKNWKSRTFQGSFSKIPEHFFINSRSFPGFFKKFY